MMSYQNKGVYHSISWNSLIILMNGKHLSNQELITPHIYVMYGSAILFLGLSRGVGHVYRGAPQYTMLIFGFSSLCTLRWYIGDRAMTNVYNYLLQLYILIITILYINTHLSV